ncbi:MAG: hypothetical protein CMN73_04225 [Sphingomonas sp.]|nr:hypothetical protein [Sphingomonas sp.]|tara:strand:- start:204 stop:476 length:273 start_codon:yes stop_codon:yes gene_type:complete
MSSLASSPPSRLSVGDPDFDWEIARRVEVLMDGVPQKYVVAYDVSAGVVEAYASDSAGGIVIDLDFHMPVILALTGNVSVRWRDDGGQDA